MSTQFVAVTLSRPQQRQNGLFSLLSGRRARGQRSPEECPRQPAGVMPCSSRSTSTRPTCSAVSPTMACLGRFQPSGARNSSSRCTPSGSSTAAQASIAALNTGELSRSSAPMPDHWLPLPAQAAHAFEMSPLHLVVFHPRPPRAQHAELEQLNLSSLGHTVLRMISLMAEASEHCIQPLHVHSGCADSLADCP